MIWNALYRWMFPELERFESAVDRQRAMQQLKEVNRGFGSSFGVMILVMFVLMAVEWSIRRSFGFADWLGPARPVLFTAIAGIVTVYLTRTRYRRIIWSCMNESLMPTCMHCGYDLRGQVDRRCPECGTAF